MYKFAFIVDVPQPFDFALTVHKPAGWYWGTPFEAFVEGNLYTAARLRDGHLVGLKLKEQAASHVEVEVFSKRELDERERVTIEERAQLGLGVDEDLDGFYDLAGRDELVRRLRDDLYGMRLGFITDVFERALLAVTLQMVPVRRSNEMRQCLIKTYGEKAAVDGRSILYWPKASVVAAAPEEKLRFECRLGYRAKAVKLLAGQILEGFPDILRLNEMAEDEIVSRLERLYGVGPYAAQIISPKRGFPLDVWSARIFYELLHGETPAEPRKMIKEMEEEAWARWGKYRRHVFAYVLNDLENLGQDYFLTKLS